MSSQATSDHSAIQVSTMARAVADSPTRDTTAKATAARRWRRTVRRDRWKSALNATSSTANRDSSTPNSTTVNSRMSRSCPMSALAGKTAGPGGSWERIRRGPGDRFSGRSSAYRGARSVAARELLAQRGELLVAGQRAAGRGRGLAAATAGGLRSRGVPARGGLVLRVGGHLLDLRRVQAVTTLRLLVARLPRLTLLVEALEPLVGLGVEALREDVVALLVVAVGHAVARRVELLREVLVGLLEAQRDPATVQVDVDDLDHGVVVDRHDLVGH